MSMDDWLRSGYVLLLVGGFCGLAPARFQVLGNAGLTAGLCGLVAAVAFVCWALFPGAEARFYAMFFSDQGLRAGTPNGQPKGSSPGEAGRAPAAAPSEPHDKGQSFTSAPQSRPPGKTQGEGSKGAGRAGHRGPAAAPGQQQAKPPSQQQEKASRAARPSAPQKPDTPRTTARRLVGSRLSAEQAAKAAEKIVSMRPFVEGQKAASLNLTWSFFDMPLPEENSFDPQHRVVQTLKAKLNRQRLLLHPDKNGHPDAERTFKFLEECHSRLTKAFVRHINRYESVQQRTQREEAELHKDNERRIQQEAERKVAQEQMQREEDAKFDQNQREEQERVRRAREHEGRLAVMLRDKEARGKAYRERVVNKTPSTPVARQSAPATGFFAMTCSPSSQSINRDDDECHMSKKAVGSLSVRLLAARDLPAQSLLMATNSYAVIRVGGYSRTSTKLPGCSPEWGSAFAFDVHRVDTALCVSVFREGLAWGLFQDELLGSVEIPFLDLEEWSGCPIGRMLEASASVLGSGAIHYMFLELQCSLTWY